MQLPPGITEEELIQQCKNGDLKRLEMLYKYFYGYAMGIGLRYCPNRDDALEVVNDAFIKAFNQLNHYNADKPFKAWFRKIIINTSIDKRRKEQKHTWHTELEQAEHIGNKAPIIELLNVNDIMDLMKRLPGVQSMIFNLYEIDGYSHDEIAAMLGLTASSSRVYLGRAKEKLRDMINKIEGNYERRV